VQGESSTGTHQALGDGLGAACKAAGTLLVVDTVAALGGSLQEAAVGAPLRATRRLQVRRLSTAAAAMLRCAAL
jgi:hypothetical protein